MTLSSVCAMIFLAALVQWAVPASADDDANELQTEPVLAEEQEPESWVARYIAAKVEGFSESEIEFSRSRSNAPFLPVAYLGASHYDDASVREFLESGEDVEYQQTSASIAAGLPFLLNQTDALVVGFYANRSEFRVDNPETEGTEEFRVNVAALGAGYFRQLSDDWQVMGFVLPFYNDSDLETGSSYWQTMGGVFGRYTASDSAWWLFGFFADTSPYDTYWLPYVGVSWTLNERWSISGVMPWPQVIYAPSRDWFVGVGGMISGSGWAIDDDIGAVNMDINAFDFGANFNRRLYGNLWAQLSAGVGGLRALQIQDTGDIEGPEFDISSSPFIRLDLAIRPGDTF